jgi:hypothetical protein
MLRVLSAAALGLAVLASPAQAQNIGRSYEPPPENKPLFDERKYRAAIERIPEAQQSSDPWAGARDPTPPPTAADVPAAKPRAKKQSSNQGVR